MRFLIFNIEKEYDQGGLEDHLNELRNYGGTPDFWDSSDSIQEARQKAGSVEFMTAIYDSESEKVFS